MITSARRNRFVSLPPWLCLLPRLENLRIDGNPFAKEWLMIVAPILSTHPPSPVHPGRHLSRLA